jgi:hypothetical protein
MIYQLAVVITVTWSVQRWRRNRAVRRLCNVVYEKLKRMQPRHGAPAEYASRYIPYGEWYALIKYSII